MPIPYPSRARALRHVHRTRAAYLYSRFPQRHILGMSCCEIGFPTQGRDHGDACLAAIERLQGALVQMHGRMRMAYEGHGVPQQLRPSRTH
ncbi:hypothetical protein [Streptomyces pacificus]|uniref:Uncharacterized protein n=1 Tax=Streptomyces pacificus TaxID=2705029 RepID=A0A6A0B0Y1_9ACTN|nr:hypothetical protein [Streptomyces pacificus]GFH38900.1 hypothetical protein SCWH03_51630 [Streptomyces pacificus]